MKRISTTIFIILAIIYWIFRVIVCLNYSMQRDFDFKPMNFNFEVIILILTIPCVIGILRRNVIGSLGYFGLYASYFGTMLYNEISEFGENILGYFSEVNGFAITFGVLIPIFILFDQLLELNGSKIEDNTSTWFYKDEKYKRDVDSRTDRNQYKIK